MTAATWLIPYSDKTHGHFTHYYAAVWKPYLISFMGSLDPTAAARDSWFLRLPIALVGCRTGRCRHTTAAHAI